MNGAQPWGKGSFKQLRFCRELGLPRWTVRHNFDYAKHRGFKRSSLLRRDYR
jgi:hypothetical protein